MLVAGKTGSVVDDRGGHRGSRRDLRRSGGVRRVRFDLGARPFLVLFELTGACDLACRHCRAEACPDPEDGELSTAEVTRVLDDLASAGSPRPVVVLTGGDPLRRDDLVEVVAHGSRAGLVMAVSPAGTSRADPRRLGELRDAGARTVSFSLDGASRETHDAFRRVDGSFAWTVAAVRAAHEVGLRVQVNTTVCAGTVSELPAVCRLVATLGAELWSVFFLVPTGRGSALRGLSAGETEDVLGFLDDVAGVVALKTTEAPAFTRMVLSRRFGERPGTGALYGQLREALAVEWPQFEQLRAAGSSSGHPAGSQGARRRSPLVVRPGNGVVFVSRHGEVSPSGFLPLVVGNVRERPLSEIYASAPLLRALRDPSQLSGRCGRCAYREVCGGSRAQAYAASGDPFAEDPTCAYQPAGAATSVGLG